LKAKTVVVLGNVKVEELESLRRKKLEIVKENRERGAKKVKERIVILVENGNGITSVSQVFQDEVRAIRSL
jgi:hypothetical protein